MIRTSNLGVPPRRMHEHAQTRQPLHSGSAIAQIFEFKRGAVTKYQTVPRLNETMPLTLYYHADEQVAKCVANLSRAGNTRTELFHKRNEKLHAAQRVLLATIFILYAEIDEDMKSCREYIKQLPPDDQREVSGGFSENIYFASQALSKGYRIRGIEQFTSELVEPARHLSAAMDALRHVLRTRLLINPLPPHNDLFPVLKDFDIAWTAFEKKICFFYFSATYHGLPGRIDETHLFQVLMSETVMRSLDSGLITLEQVQSFDPCLILSIPRLSLLSALYHTDMVNVTDEQNAFRWFRSNAKLLKGVKNSISRMSPGQINSLERILANVDHELPPLSVKPIRDDSGDQIEEEMDASIAVQAAFVEICRVSDGLIRNKEMQMMLSQVLSMHNTNTSSDSS